MNRRTFLYLGGALTGFAIPSVKKTLLFSESLSAAPAGKLLGMYVHEGWPYNHPYAARTWIVEDWRGYADGLSKLGFNTFIIWPAIETMPDPLTDSDRAHLEVTASVVRMLREEFHFRVYITLCPNVVPYPQVAARYSFETRPLFASITLLDPSDTKAVKAMLDRWEKILKPMAEMDGLVLIDSDPGGYPGSTNAQFVSLLHEYRKMLDRLRPGIEVVYWMHAGWETYSRMEKTGVFQWGDPAVSEDVLVRLKKVKMDPWRITIHTYDAPPNGTDLKLAEKMGLASTSLAFNYGALEAEPSFPLTNFGGEAAFKAGEFSAPGGVVGNAQTHCMQLPNTFALARGGEGKTLPTYDDYVQFANQLIEGKGQAIVAGWKVLSGTDSVAMRSAATQLQTIAGEDLNPGPLKGLLFGDPHRFVIDLVMELQLKAAFEDFVTATQQNSEVKQTLKTFVDAADAYQKRTGYQCLWGWPNLQEALMTLKSPKIDAILDETKFATELINNTGIATLGDAYHNRYSDGFMRAETSTPRLIAAMKDELARLQETP